jgi:hypothetical protein
MVPLRKPFLAVIIIAAVLALVYWTVTAIPPVLR